MWQRFLIALPLSVLGLMFLGFAGADFFFSDVVHSADPMAPSRLRVNATGTLWLMIGVVTISAAVYTLRSRRDQPPES